MERIEDFCGVYCFLSNFYPYVIVGAKGISYPTSEAAFQGGKTVDLKERAWIAAAKTPNEAKKTWPVGDADSGVE